VVTVVFDQDGKAYVRDLPLMSMLLCFQSVHHRDEAFIIIEHVEGFLKGIDSVRRSSGIENNGIQIIRPWKIFC